MADPVSLKTGLGGIPITGAEGATPVEKKSGAGSFAAVKEEVAASKEKAQLPPAVESVSEAERKQLISDVRQRMESSPGAKPQEVYGPDMQGAETRMNKLRRRVEQLPKGAEADALKQRLELVDQQYQGAARMLEKMPAMDDPRKLLQLQMQMYQMSQNLELVSKTVEQVNSGVKQIMQTQV